jgi:hypothetical protein
MNKITINAREEGKFSIKYSDIILVQDYSLSNTHFIIIIYPFNNQVATATIATSATALQLGLFVAVAVVAVTASAATGCSLESVFYHHNLASS